MYVHRVDLHYHEVCNMNHRKMGSCVRVNQTASSIQKKEIQSRAGEGIKCW